MSTHYFSRRGRSLRRKCEAQPLARKVTHVDRSAGQGDCFHLFKQTQEQNVLVELKEERRVD